MPRTRLGKKAHPSTDSDEPGNNKKPTTTTTTRNPNSSDNNLDLEITGEAHSSTQTSTITRTPKNSSEKEKFAAPGSPKELEDSTIKRARKTTSNVWSHFNSSGQGEKKKVNCKYCQHMMLANPACGTKHLWRHLDRCSSYTSNTKQSLLQVSSTSTKEVLTWVFSQKASRNLLTKLVIANEKPFTSVEHPIFKAFVALLQPKFKLHGRITLKKDVIDMYQSMKATFAKEIAQVNCLALTTNLWTSSHQTPFIVVLAHFILDDWLLHKRLISFQELPPPHNGLTIADQLIALIIEWKAIDKVAFVTVDNASSNNVALARVSQILKDKIQLPPNMNGKFLHVRCAVSDTLLHYMLI
ncbi:hypothetical protein PCANC_02802 [Puccinia coronata f. sp. avenae]|uniref:BED-type domain-containing protein n=1 Tax=Puccinia coronata f. sp. avenae TaxID=200324 RepID=A0A2N5W438_9BASI|nr:hypothetical protein PCANC_02802 [Puccinia coronata f. sp. avenae]